MDKPDPSPSGASAANAPDGPPDEARFTLYCACKECTVAIQANTRIRFFCEACSWWRTSGPHFHDCDHTMPGAQPQAPAQSADAATLGPERETLVRAVLRRSGRHE